MRHQITVFLSFFVLLGACLTAGTAHADYFVWRDVKTGLSLSFPDTWHRVSNADHNDILTIMPPSGRAQASCRVRGWEDGRHLIYPQRFNSAIQKIDFSLSFWDNYLQEYDNHQIYNMQDSAGLGRGYAGYAIAGYQSPVPGPFMDRKALMSAALYNGEVYVLECSAHADAFDQWKGRFLSIAHSIDFNKAYHELYVGNYRDFMDDPRIQFKGAEGDDSVLY